MILRKDTISTPDMPSIAQRVIYQDIEFKTIDGLTIRGSLYPAANKGPAVIMTPGVSAIQFTPLLRDLIGHSSTV